jgi:mRNA-degrading endonuclease RelE of RelBE toxin-antitoxin system
MSYIILRGRWYDNIVLKVHIPTKNKIDGMKESFHEELERVCDKFPKCHKIILLGISLAKYVRKKISNYQLGMRVYTKILMVTEFE